MARAERTGLAPRMRTTFETSELLIQVRLAHEAMQGILATSGLDDFFGENGGLAAEIADAERSLNRLRDAVAATTDAQNGTEGAGADSGLTAAQTRLRGLAT
jgi:hypothetical protein